MKLNNFLFYTLLAIIVASIAVIIWIIYNEEEINGSYVYIPGGVFIAGVSIMAMKQDYFIQ
jgi:hypothetical protein